MADEPIDVARIFKDFERYFEATARAKKWSEDDQLDKRDELFLDWLERHPRIAIAEYRAALEEYDRRRAATIAEDDARKRERILRRAGLGAREEAPHGRPKF